MPTIVGARMADGVVLAGDRLALRGTHVVSEDFSRIHRFDALVVGSSAAQGDVQSLLRELDDRVRTYEHTRGHPPGKPAFARILADRAAEVEAECLGAARGEDGQAHLLRVEADGAWSHEPIAAIGTGGGIAIGLLEGMDREIAAETAADRLEDVLRTVAARDTATGDTIDVEILTDDAE